MKAFLVSVAAVVGAFVVHGCLSDPSSARSKSAPTFERPPVVRVLLASATEIAVACAAPVHVESESGSQELEEFGTQTIRREGDALVVGSTSLGGSRIRLTPFGGLLGFGGRAYRGSFEVLVSDGGLMLVNCVDAEDYLVGVLGKEMNLSYTEATLKAQVVAARTYVLYECVRRRAAAFDVYDDERSQVYGGLERETEAARRLVEETRGIVVRHEGAIFKAFYASTCGGATDKACEVLNDALEDIPPLSGATCGYCEDAPLYRWEMPAKSLAEVSRLLAARIENGKVVNVEIGRTLSSGRAATVIVTAEVGGAAKAFELKANEDFRRAVSARDIKSTLWDEVACRGGKLYLKGRGWGHGAGMCQMGARGMGRAGKNFDEILTHYYPGAKVEKIY